MIEITNKLLFDGMLALYWMGGFLMASLIFFLFQVIIKYDKIKAKKSEDRIAKRFFELSSVSLESKGRKRYTKNK